MPFNPDKLAKLVSKGASTGVRTGGKGTVRRKRKAVRKNTTHDDKRLKSTLNKLSVRDIPAIEEVNLFKDDGHVIHFANPKVQASIAANTYVVSGNAETKKLQDLLPGIITQLGPDHLNDLKKIYAQFAAEKGKGGDDEDDVPDLVEGENFEDVSNAPAAAAATETKKEEPKKAEEPAAAATAAATPAAAAAATTEEPKKEKGKGKK